MSCEKTDLEFEVQQLTKQRDALQQLLENHLAVPGGCKRAAVKRRPAAAAAATYTPMAAGDPTSPHPEVFSPPPFVTSPGGQHTIPSPHVPQSPHGSHVPPSPQVPPSPHVPTTPNGQHSASPSGQQPLYPQASAAQSPTSPHMPAHQSAMQSTNQMQPRQTRSRSDNTYQTSISHGQLTSQASLPNMSLASPITSTGQVPDGTISVSVQSPVIHAQDNKQTVSQQIMQGQFLTQQAYPDITMQVSHHTQASSLRQPGQVLGSRQQMPCQTLAAPARHAMPGQVQNPASHGLSQQRQHRPSNQQLTSANYVAPQQQAQSSSHLMGQLTQSSVQYEQTIATAAAAGSTAPAQYTSGQTLSGYTHALFLPTQQTTIASAQQDGGQWGSASFSVTVQAPGAGTVTGAVAGTMPGTLAGTEFSSPAPVTASSQGMFDPAPTGPLCFGATLPVNSEEDRNNT